MDCENCGNCKFSIETGPRLYCRRFPPSRVSPASWDYKDHNSMYPSVDPGEWCGEYKGG